MVQTLLLKQAQTRLNARCFIYSFTLLSSVAMSILAVFMGFRNYKLFLKIQIVLQEEIYGRSSLLSILPISFRHDFWRSFTVMMTGLLRVNSLLKATTWHLLGLELTRCAVNSIAVGHFNL